MGDEPENYWLLHLFTPITVPANGQKKILSIMRQKLASKNYSLF